jgi:hypothetical protein
MNSFNREFSYSFTKAEVKLLYESYYFILNTKYLRKDLYYMHNEPKAFKIRKLVNHNWEFAVETLKNHYHIAIWNQLKFLTESETFNIVDFMEDKEYGELMLEIFNNNILEIIQFLTDNCNDIWLACIIIYIFQNVFNFNKKKVLQILLESFENLRRYKFYNISAKLMKFANFDKLKVNKENTLFFVSCKNCGYLYDATSLGSCTNCQTKIKCQIW